MYKTSPMIDPIKEELSFKHLQNIFRSFNMLTEIRVGSNCKYLYQESDKRCKIVAVFHGILNIWYVNVSYINNREQLKGKLKKRNYVNISSYSEKELRQLLKAIIKSFN